MVQLNKNADWDFPLPPSLGYVSLAGGGRSAMTTHRDNENVKCSEARD